MTSRTATAIFAAATALACAPAATPPPAAPKAEAKPAPAKAPAPKQAEPSPSIIEQKGVLRVECGDKIVDDPNGKGAGFTNGFVMFKADEAEVLIRIPVGEGKVVDGGGLSCKFSAADIKINQDTERIASATPRPDLRLEFQCKDGDNPPEARMPARGFLRLDPAAATPAQKIMTDASGEIARLEGDKVCAVRIEPAVQQQEASLRKTAPVMGFSR